MEIRNADKADPDRNMPYSASLDSHSHQHCFPFELLGRPRAIGQHDENGTIECLPDE
jgi:hypothetical protein